MSYDGAGVEMQPLECEASSTHDEDPNKMGDIQDSPLMSEAALRQMGRALVSTFKSHDFDRSSDSVK